MRVFCTLVHRLQAVSLRRVCVALGAVAGVFDYQKGDEMNAQKPDRHELQANGKHPAPCARFCEATAKVLEGMEPVYQYQLANGNWIDQTKESYDYNVKHGQATVRMLYATPQPKEKQ